MKTTKNNNNYIVISYIIILLLNAQLFFLPKIYNFFEPFNDYHNKLLITVITIIIFMMWLVVNKFNIRFTKMGLFVLIFTIFSLFLAMIQSVSSFEKNQDIMSNYYYNLIPLLYFPLLEIDLKKILKWFLRIGFLYSISAIITFITLNLSLVTAENVNTLVNYVNGELRLPQTSDLIGLTAVIFMIYSNEMGKRKIKTTGIVLYFLMIILFISKVRMVFLTVSIIFIFYIINDFIQKKGTLYKVFIYLIIIFCFAILFLKIRLLEVIIGSGQKAASVYFRFEVIKHYGKHFMDNIIFGFGHSKNVKEIYNYTDIGFLGFIFRYGIIGTVWLFTWLVYQLRELMNFKRNTTVIIFLYIIITGISLSLFDAQRVIYFPLLMVVFDKTLPRKVAL